MIFGSKRLLGYTLLLLGLGAFALLTIVSAAFVFSSRAQFHAREALNAALVDQALLDYQSDLIDAETAQRGYLLTGRQDFLDPYRQALADVERDGQELRAAAARLSSAPISNAEVDAIIALGARKMTLVREGVEQGAGDAARRDANLDAGKTTMDEIRAKAGDIGRKADALRRSQRGEMRRAASTLTTLISLGVGMVLVLAVGAALVLRRHVRELDAARLELMEVNQDLEARVVERTEGVMRANDELQRYAYIVGHDLRAPLVNIMGFVSELETATKTLTDYIAAHAEPGDPALADVTVAADEDIPEALGFIRSSMTRMDNLINEILKLSRAGRRVLEPAPLDTDALVRTCIDAIRQRFDDAEASVHVAGKLPAIVSDRLALEQIFSNLLDNAAKYLRPGTPGRIEVRGRLQGANALFEIEDNGRGVAPADQERIFELFRRAGAQDQPGEGIGLAHTRALARRLGGDVTVTSDGASGTVFTVSVARDLPLRLWSVQK